MKSLIRFLPFSWPDTCIRAGRRFSHHWTLVWGRGIHHNHYTTPRHRSVYHATIIIIIIGITTIVAITFAASKIPTIKRSIDQQCWCRLPSTSSARCLFSQFLGPSTTARFAFANVNYCQLFQLRLPFMVLASVFQVSLTSRLLPSHQVISKKWWNAALSWP